jgi:hypothetical protein
MTAAPLSSREKRLKKSLDALLSQYGPDEIGSDPVSFLHRYHDPPDAEVAGFIAASLAYGRVALIEKSVARALEPMGDHPARFIREFSPRRQGHHYRGFVHRFTRGKDLVALFVLLREMLARSGSIENFMCGNGEGGISGRKGGSGVGPEVSIGGRSEVHAVWGPGSGAENSDRVGEILSDFSKRALSLRPGDIYAGRAIPRDAGVRYFFPSPSDGSACKRLNLFLRWMVRGPDGVDIGIWRSISPKELVVPLDVHMGRVARFIGLTHRRDNLWKSAREITAALGRLDPEDPVKYDYAVTRLGIQGICSGGKKTQACEACPLRAHCLCRHAAV